ncbi:unnamed protein product [Pseudo-nitzschia multistriata]|uniref:Uncharacterized protein n=1 Tax=Pseudo-nitzschia multistriata TaxID=183589 RepID=A0A448ZPK4_9STRA|nr:unnamed protein product [Pseudo-nitzschia multistriata]
MVAGTDASCEATDAPEQTKQNQQLQRKKVKRQGSGSMSNTERPSSPIKSIKKSIRNRLQRIKDGKESRQRHSQRNGLRSRPSKEEKQEKTQEKKQLQRQQQKPQQKQHPFNATLSKQKKSPQNAVGSSGKKQKVPAASSAKQVSSKSNNISESNAATANRNTKPLVKNYISPPSQTLQASTRTEERREEKSPVRNRREKRNKKTKKHPSQDATTKQRNSFRSFSESSDDYDYSDHTGLGANRTYDSVGDEEDDYFDRRYSRSYDTRGWSYSTRTGSRSSSSSSSDGSYDSSSFDDDESTISATKRTMRMAVHRNPSDDASSGRGRSRNPRRRPPPSSPRAREDHISSPRRNPRMQTNRFVDDDYYYEGTNTNTDDESQSCYSGLSSGNEYSRSCSSGVTSGGTFETNDDDDYSSSSSNDADERDFRNPGGGRRGSNPHRKHPVSDDEDQSECWTEAPVRTYDSEEESDRSSGSYSKKNHGQCVLDPVTTYDCEEGYGNGSGLGLDLTRTQTDDQTYTSRDIDPEEFAAFVQEQEAAEQRAERKKKDKSEGKDAAVGSGVFSWIFGGTAETTEPEERTAPASPARRGRSPAPVRSPRAHQGDTDRRAFFDDEIRERSTRDSAGREGCGFQIDHVLNGGDSIADSYGGLREGEFLLSNRDSAATEPGHYGGTSERMHSMDKGRSGSFGASGTNNARASLPPRSTAAETPSPAEEEEDEGSSFLYCCLSPNHSFDKLKDGTGESGRLPPSSGALRDEFEQTAVIEEPSFEKQLGYREAEQAFAPEYDEATLASTIFTEANQGSEPRNPRSPSGSWHPRSTSGFDPEGASPCPSTHRSWDGNDAGEMGDARYPRNEAESWTGPVGNTEEYGRGQDCDAEQIEMELGSYHPDPDHISLSSNDTDSLTYNGEEEAAITEQVKTTVKAECLEDYDVSNVLHGKRSFKSKTTEDGSSILPLHSPSERRERRKNAMKAHRDFLYNMSTSASACNTEDHDRNDADDAEGAVEPGEENGSDQHEGEVAVETPGIAGSSSSSGSKPNSIVHDNAGRSSDADKPDDIIGLVRNAFTVMISSKTEDEADPEASVLNESKPDLQVDQETAGLPLAQEEASTSGPQSSVEEALNAAYRFFAPSQADEPLINEPVHGEKQILQCTNFEPNPVSRPEATVEDPVQEFPPEETIEEKNSIHSVSSTPSDEAVTNKLELPKKPKAIKDVGYNVEGIPLELRPQKIWRVPPSTMIAEEENYMSPTCAKESYTAQIAEAPASPPESIRDAGREQAEDASIAEQQHEPSPPSDPVPSQMESDIDTNDKKLGRHAQRFRRGRDLRRFNRRLQQGDGEKRPVPTKEPSLPADPPEKQYSDTSNPRVQRPHRDAVPSPIVAGGGETTRDTAAGALAAPSMPDPVSPRSNKADFVVGSRRSNLSEIRSRIKQRRKSKLQSRHQAEQLSPLNGRRDAASPQRIVSKHNTADAPTKRSGIEAAKTRNATVRSAENTPVVNAATDRRDDSASCSSKDGDEFFDTITFDEDNMEGIIDAMTPPRVQRYLEESSTMQSPNTIGTAISLD